jgi:hypothetical protein
MLDLVDALTTERLYKLALPVGWAVEELRRSGARLVPLWSLRFSPRSSVAG